MKIYQNRFNIQMKNNLMMIQIKKLNLKMIESKKITFWPAKKNNLMMFTFFYGRRT